jgi:dTDP-4-dehydrorhamnose reductase
MRIALTGAGGGLGTAFLARAAAGQDVVAFSHADLPVEDRSAVRRAIVGARPELVIHTAAKTAVDACQRDAEAAFRVNELGSRNVALAAGEAGALLLAISTDYVFDGEKGEPYDETDRPNPLSVYGASKLAGERAAAEAPQHLVVRTSWVFGGGKDFLTGALRRLAGGEQAPAIADMVASPTFVGHLADRLVPLAESGHRGMVHLAGPEPSSWHDLLVRAVERFGLPGEVVPQKAEELARPAPRPRNSSLTSVVLTAGEVPAMPPLLDGVAEIVEGFHGYA